ncbi:site-specific DNA-methyltransferase [Brevibacillus ruminantium]|uniref:site-specific DNA-methyltransferase (cytosine-N(4)-specific) n=1 Tax=Brevibacillus ruminantium TaxID=2950604 RepID=A0ABY4WC76_9BACL|nr:DNA methyltransferase [Brevibacillus ruminantium]USG64782.1 site-specific DNA-methyltransferase [Brevibacillus ruminantium]
MNNLQLELFDEIVEKTNKKKTDTSSTFLDNMKLPIHRWFRYSAGFSAEWVESVITSHLKDYHKAEINVFDPFTGSGTVLLASDNLGVNSMGVEAHPFVSKITNAKLQWNTDVEKFYNFAKKLLERAKMENGSTEGYPDLIYKCYPPESLQQLDAIVRVLKEGDDNSPEHKLSWVALVSILRACAPVGTASWQYVLPNKTKAKMANPFEAYEKQINIMAYDMRHMQSKNVMPKAQFFQEDARECPSIPSNSVDLVITSPPYANNYDYADATRLEMSFFGEVSGWGDLREKVSQFLVRSCTQHVSKYKDYTFEILKDDVLKPIYGEILDVCQRLDEERVNHGGKKNYHTMIATYFLDLAKVWIQLRRVCKDGSNVCFVIGDSAPYGIYVPVDKWLGDLAIAAGFKEYSFEKTRDRNVKWKNRKHEVPLKEGRLWVKG